MASFYVNHHPPKPNDRPRPLPPPPPRPHFLPPPPPLQSFQPPYPPQFPPHPHNPGYPGFPPSGGQNFNGPSAPMHHPMQVAPNLPVPPPPPPLGNSNAFMPQAPSKPPPNMPPQNTNPQGNSAAPPPHGYPPAFPPQNFTMQPPNASLNMLPPPPPWSNRPPNASSVNPVPPPAQPPAANPIAESVAQPPSKPAPPPPSEPNPNVQKNANQRGETEEERRQRKKREYEKQKKEQERRREEKKEHSKSQLSHGVDAKSNRSGHSQQQGNKSSKLHEKDSHTEAKARSGNASDHQKVGNHLNRPSTFLCKINFLNELPSFSSQPKLLKIINDPDRYSRYAVTGEEKNSKHRLHVELDLGIPLDLLDMSVYNAPPPHLRPPLDEADEALLRDIAPSSVNEKSESSKIKSRPTDKGLNWLIHTQYISTVDLVHTPKKTLSEKEENMLSILEENVLQTKESQIQSIESSFAACKQKPVHPTNPSLEPVEILPILPNFDRMGEKFVQIVFDSDPMAELSTHRSLDESLKEKIETKAILQNFRLSGKNSNAIVGCMLPKINQAEKPLKVDDEIEYEWLREYLWTFSRADSYVFCFNENNVTYIPVESKLNIHKRKAKEGKEEDNYYDDQRLNNEFPIPSQIKVKRRRMNEEEEKLRLRNKNLLLEGTDLETEEAADVVREAIQSMNDESEAEEERIVDRESKHDKKERNKRNKREERYSDDEYYDKETYANEDDEENDEDVDFNERKYERKSHRRR